MEENYEKIGPKTTLSEIVIMAVTKLSRNNLSVFEFDIHGISIDGRVVLHFEASLQQAGSD